VEIKVFWSKKGCRQKRSSLEARVLFKSVIYGKLEYKKAGSMGPANRGGGGGSIGRNSIVKNWENFSKRNAKHFV